MSYIAAAGAAWLAFAAAPAAAAPTPQPFGANGFPGFHDVLPPGTNGLVNPVELAQYEANHGARPAHNDDQRDMYATLVQGAPNIGGADLPKYYKDGTFGVRPGDVASTTSPRDDVTIVRDKQFGIPHIYGSTRAGGEFGLGYAAAQDRLFFIDILRHLGRAQLTAFAGGAPYQYLGRYASLGGNELEIARTLILDPLRVVRVLLSGEVGSKIAFAKRITRMFCTVSLPR